VLCVPAAVGLAVAADPILALIYEHGRFGPSDTRASALALAAYAVGLTGYASIKVLGPAFYALGDARTPAAVSVASVAVNLACNWIAIRILHLGHGGLALSTSLVALWDSALLLFLLSRRLGGLRLGIAGTAGRVAIAAALMGAACWLWIDWTGASERGFGAALRVVVTTVPLGIGVYAAVGLGLGIPELRVRLRR